MKLEKARKENPLDQGFEFILNPEDDNSKVIEDI
jgi:hypothetical protein